ncbi:hypothetical protein SAMN04488008_10484 [Maribacter orientalis]|uniref:Uncharacterized protein n=1 Tax=Maribacter orientalis TaxID=228957 RepID=A0A1H7QTU3_9FLAO|nr:hypothetical protein [Maribacter orientalis]SEL51430.1 hypothetical protein SAMN04488008_10484 [Maribacter orientalis]
MNRLLILMFFISNLCFSQGVQGIGRPAGVLTPAQMGMSFFEVPIDGSPYMNEIFKKGKTIINGKHTSDALMRYDAYRDAIEIKNENDVARTLLRRSNIVADIDGTIYMVREYRESGENKLGYFNPLNEGYARLLKKPKKIFVQAENPENGYDKFKPAKYQDISMYYMQKGDEPAIETKLSKRKILSFLDDSSEILKQYIKKNELNMRLESDIIQLINYYNTQETNKKIL